MELGLGEMRYEGANKHGGFTLSDEGGGSSNDSFSSGDLHRPEEKDCEFADEPLNESPIVELSRAPLASTFWFKLV